MKRKRPSSGLRNSQSTTTLPAEFAGEIVALRAKKKLHTEVCRTLIAALHRLFPDWVCISEIGQTAGGRNDTVLFESGGESICFELFASKGQVDRDLLLLHDSPAKHKIAVLVDREIDASIAEAYYRKRPSAPYPTLWVSDIMLSDRSATLYMKLTQYVLGNQLAHAFLISRQIAQTARHRTLVSWVQDGIKIHTENSVSPTFMSVMTLLAINRLLRLGISLEHCKNAAREINENFEFLIRQILVGVPMLLIGNQNEYLILDITDYHAWLLGSVFSTNPDHVVVLLNTLYDQLRSVYKGHLPKAGDMSVLMETMYGNAPSTTKIS